METTWKDRLLAEHLELEGRRQKLEKFLDTKEFEALDSRSRALLRIQIRAMLTYEEILVERIEVD